MSKLVISSLDVDCHIGNIASMDNLKTWRSDRGLNLKQAGKLVGVSDVQWHRYETGKRRIPSGKVPAISKATKIPPHELRPDLADIFGPAPKQVRATA